MLDIEFITIHLRYRRRNEYGLCESFGVYPSYVADILNSVKKIISLFCSEKINYEDYVKKCIVSKECTFKLPKDYSFKVVFS